MWNNQKQQKSCFPFDILLIKAIILLMFSGATPAWASHLKRCLTYRVAVTRQLTKPTLSLAVCNLMPTDHKKLHFWLINDRNLFFFCINVRSISNNMAWLCGQLLVVQVIYLPILSGLISLALEQLYYYPYVRDKNLKFGDKSDDWFIPTQ